MNDEFRIETPESVSFGYDVAGIGSRFMAAMVDSLLIVIMQVVVLMVTLAVLSASPDDLFSGELGIWVAAVLGLLAFALFWGYYLFFEMIWNGQSPGKRWVGLRVIKDSGAPISLVDSAIRNLVLRRKIPFRKPGGRLMFIRSELIQWIQQAPGLSIEDIGK